MDEVNKLAFKTAIMKLLTEQELVIDIDEQIKCLKEICRDLREEEKRQIKKATK
jgi:hypothetical protein